MLLYKIVERKNPQNRQDPGKYYATPVWAGKITTEELARRMAELSPEEARLLKLEAEPSEALSMEIFNEMKTWSPELQHRAALALQAYWSALGKWEGRQSKKQEAKIKAVKALL